MYLSASQFSTPNENREKRRMTARRTWQDQEFQPQADVAGSYRRIRVSDIDSEDRVYL